MTLQEKLNAMNTNKTSISISTTTWSRMDGLAWTCRLQYQNDNREAFDITSDSYDNVTAGVDEVYEKFLNLTKSVFVEARPALLTHSSDSLN